MAQSRNLWSYHRVANAPSGVHLRNAEELLPLTKARLYLDHNFTIHHIADLVRFRAIADHPGTGQSSNTHILAPPGAPTGVPENLSVQILGFASLSFVNA